MVTGLSGFRYSLHSFRTASPPLQSGLGFSVPKMNFLNKGNRHRAAQ